MNYSEEFKQKLKDVYPSFLTWHRMAEEGDVKLVKEIESFEIGIITPEEVVESIQKGREGVNNLYSKAKRMSEQNILWNMAMDIIFEYDG